MDGPGPPAEIRPMAPGEVAACEQVWHEAQAHLRRSMHLPELEVTPARVARMRARIDHLRGTDPDGSYVAEQGGRVVGVAQALVREGLWVLSLFGVAVGAQGSGLGRRLLDAALGCGDGMPGLIFCSHDPRAMRLYTLAGFTLHPAVAAFGEVAASAVDPVPVTPVTSHPPHLDAALDLVDEADRATRGASRRPDLEHLLVSAAPPELLTHDERRGYVVADRTGPLALAAEDEGTATDLLLAALAWAASRARDGADAGVREAGEPWVGVPWLTARQPWAVEACLRAGLRLHPAGPVMVRGLPGLPIPYLPSGAYG